MKLICSIALLLVLQLSRKLPLSPSLVSALFVEVTRRCHVDLQAQGAGRAGATLHGRQAFFESQWQTRGFKNAGILQFLLLPLEEDDEMTD